jgi:lysine-specific demethylase/histidyl-hydroxylase NO66
MDIVLSPGDLLYMPRGTVHRAVSLDDAASTHLTLSSYQRHAWSDLLAHMLPKLLESVTRSRLELRSGLPIDFLTHAGSAAAAAASPPSSERASFESGATAAMRSIFEQASTTGLVEHLAHEAADQLGADFMQNRLPPYRSLPPATSPDASATPGITSTATSPPLPDLDQGEEVEVRLCAPMLRRLVLGSFEDGSGDFVQLQHCVANQRKAHMTRPSGFAGNNDNDDDDDEEEEEEEEDGAAAGK